MSNLSDYLSGHLEQNVGQSTKVAMSQKATTDQLASKVQGDHTKEIGISNKDKRKPYIRSSFDDVIFLGVSAGNPIPLGDIGTNSTGRPMLITFMSTFSAQFAMNITVEDILVGRFSNASRENSSGSVSVIVLDGQKWKANSVESAIGWTL